jgi:hypothetical protein
MTEPEAGARTTVARFATVRLAGDTAGELPLDFSALLRDSMVTGMEVTHYRKTWRLGQVRELEGRTGILTGSIGFDDTSTGVGWDAEAKDWIEVDVPSGSRFPYVLDLERGLFAYEAAQSAGVLSALQALLNSAEQGRWRVQRVLNEQSWEDFRARVKRVRRLKLVLHRPNPNYVGRERVEELLEQSRAELLRLTLETPEDDLEGLDLSAAYVAQAITHVELGYGTLKADGTERVGQEEVERRYDSASKGAEHIVEVPVASTGTATGLTLSDALSTVQTEDLIEEGDDDDDDAP